MATRSNYPDTQGRKAKPAMKKKKKKKSKKKKIKYGY